MLTLKYNIMYKIKLSILFLLFSFCNLLSYAEASDSFLKFVFSKKNPGSSSGTGIRPLSVTAPPDGCLIDGVLTIYLNTASIYTNIEISRVDGEIVENDVLIHGADRVVEYDMSMYESGEYVVTITFSNMETYEASVTVE